MAAGVKTEGQEAVERRSPALNPRFNFWDRIWTKVASQLRVPSEVAGDLPASHCKVLHSDASSVIAL